MYAWSLINDRKLISSQYEGTYFPINLYEIITSSASNDTPTNPVM